MPVTFDMCDRKMARVRGVIAAANRSTTAWAEVA